MSECGKREDAIKYLKEIQRLYVSEDKRIKQVIDMLSADVIEVGKAYPREELEKYGLSEWKDKHGQRWVMIERRDND